MIITAYNANSIIINLLHRFHKLVNELKFIVVNAYYMNSKFIKDNKWE